jgi:hypothetical protein
MCTAPPPPAIQSRRRRLFGALLRESHGLRLGGGEEVVKRRVDEGLATVFTFYFA